MSSTDQILPGEGHVDRWTASRKEEVLRRIRAGEISAAEAMRRWHISVEELDGWARRFRAGGRPGLRATQPALFGDGRQQHAPAAAGNEGTSHAAHLPKSLGGVGHG